MILALQIGFRLPQYDYFEPNEQTQFENVTLIREDNRQTEQTFAVSISLSDSGAGVRPATFQSSLANQLTGFDYFLYGAPGITSITINFSPTNSGIIIPFTLLPDELPEGTEGFRLSIASLGNPNFQLPVENPESDVPAYTNTLIHILDNDSKSIHVTHCC